MPAPNTLLQLQLSYWKEFSRQRNTLQAHDKEDKQLSFVSTSFDTRRKEANIIIPNYLCINDIYQSSCSPEDHLVVKSWVKKVHLPRKIPDLEIHKGAIGNVIFIDLVGTFQKEGLVGGHFVKHHLLKERR